MKIGTTSKSLNNSVESKPGLSSVSLSFAALSIADEFTGKERRYNNIIVYDFP